MFVENVVMRAVMEMDWALGKQRGGACQPAWGVRDHVEGGRLNLSLEGQAGVDWMVNREAVGYSRWRWNKSPKPRIA